VKFRLIWFSPGNSPIQIIEFFNSIGRIQPHQLDLRTTAIGKAAVYFQLGNFRLRPIKATPDYQIIPIPNLQNVVCPLILDYVLSYDCATGVPP
ncbi:MAG: hypothetical protein ACERLB_04530, partial [Gammaproteobacteria bacterium]